MTKLRAFQRDGVRQIYKFRGRALNADEQGLGKTIQALYWIKCIPKHRPVIIVTPASLKYTWQHEAMAHFGIHAVVIEGRRKRRMMDLPGEITIINYDILKSWLPCLLKHKPRVVVIDEIQYCANVRSVRTRACIKLADGVSSVLGLSGTPFTNKLIELWPVLHIVKPELFPDRIQYAWDYCKPRYVHPWGWRFDGAVNKGRLKDILEEHCMIRRLKRDVAKELPAKQESIIWTRLKDYSDYHAAESDFLSWLRKISPARAIRARRSAALTRVGYLLRLVARLKLPRVVQWIKEFYELHPDKKLVAFTMNRFVIDALKEQFPHALVIDGRVKGRMREEVKNRFQTHKKSKLLIGHWKAAGVGLTLTAAHNVLACDLPWVPPVVWQGIDRVHRIGQKDKVVAHYIVTLGTIEEKQLKAHNQKAKIFHAVFDRKKPKNFKDFNVLDELLHSYYSLIAR